MFPTSFTAARRAALVAVALTLAVAGCATGDDTGADQPEGFDPGGPVDAEDTTTTTPPTPAAETTLTRTSRITGDIAPKSVVASGAGVVFAQNMMYRHSVTAYRSDGTEAATIPDGVDLADFGISGHPGVSAGAPVEAAFTSDGRYAYVSNYAMYGNGFGREGTDTCTPASGYDDSFVYRIDTDGFAIDQVIAVGSVPKYVAVTPDDSRVLVTNWCTWDLSVIDTETAKETARIPIGRYPRGITVSPDSSTAYVAVMGGDVIKRVHLDSGAVDDFTSTGDGPRHIVSAPDGSALYVTNNHDGTVSRVDVANGTVTTTVATGSQPRSMAISADGTALYVVNYESSTVTKLRASDLAELATLPTDHHPIGITYEPTTRSVWVACYGGSILVFDDATAA